MQVFADKNVAAYTKLYLIIVLYENNSSYLTYVYI